MTMTGMDDYLMAIELRRGFVARSDVLEVGLDDRFIRRQIVTGAWRRVRNGAYCSSLVWDGLDALERHRRLSRAVLQAHGDGVVLSKASALVMREGCDIWGIDLSRVHVTRRDGRSGSVESDVVHHEGAVTDQDIDEVDGLLVMREDRSVVETIASCPSESGLVVADSVLHKGRVQLEQLELAHAATRRCLGSRTVDLVLRLADGRAESVGETRARYLYWTQGLPRPELQFVVLDHDGRLVGRTDLAWPSERLLVEFDGRVKYGRLLLPGQDAGDVVFAEKLREDELRRVTGFAVERLTWKDLSTPALTARRARQRMCRHSA